MSCAMTIFRGMQHGRSGGPTMLRRNDINHILEFLRQIK
jgi:hypothetical protein